MPFRAPAYIRSIPPYPAGQVAEELQRELGLDRLTVLASNENTAGPPPAALEAVAEAATGLHRYPEGTGLALREALAERHGLTPEQVILGNGSAELVELVCKAFVRDRQRVVNSALAFVQYRLSAQTVNAEIVDVATHAGSLADDAEALAAASAGARMVFIANPNNPTGTFITRDELDAYFRRVDEGVLTVVDQAYREYIDLPDYPDAVDDLRAGRNVLVLGTFSKIYGLAGLRIGYGLGPAALLAQVEGARLPFNTNTLAQVGALAALGESEHLAASRERNLTERRFLEGELARRGVPFTPSIANFLLVDCGRPAAEVSRRFLEQGVLIRPMHGYGLPTHQRVTVGDRDENLHFLAALDHVLLGAVADAR